MDAQPSTVEEAVDLFLALRRAGQASDSKAFAVRYPHLDPDLSSALDALIALEHATGRDVDTDVSIPDRVGAFRVVREIGRGGMGVVLEAVEEPLGRRVALKVLPPELLASPDARARFRREAELAARLDHSGIATIYGAGVEDEQPWIAMRFVEGRTLARAIADSKKDGASCLRLSVSSARGRESALRVADLLAKVARALQAAHEQGVVHRDIKPSNIIVQPDGMPVLLDFGLAITAETDGPSVTKTGEAPGTPAYLAPEILAGEIARPDAQVDVYGLGVVLYECLALRRPYDTPTLEALYRTILAGWPAPLRATNPTVPRDLAVVVATAMERDRDRRYRSAHALAEDLEACVAGRPIAARPISLAGRMARWVRREPRLAAAISAAVAIAIGGLAWISVVQAAAAKDVAAKNAELATTNAGLAVAKALAESNERIAAQRADDVFSLSAIQELKELADEAGALWPAFPEKIPAYDAWLLKARILIEGRPGGHPGLRDHEEKLAEIRSRGKGETHDFDDPKDRWWHAQLVQLVADLKSFSDPEHGLFSEGISEEHGWGIVRRRREAASIEERSVGGAEARRRWEEAIAAIAVSPKYGGMRLAPQMGLLPIGPDPESGLWEFACLQSGDPAERGADGKLVVKEPMGLVLVLIPGGGFGMGTQTADPTGWNYFASARADESPVHEVELSPYFLSKYEMTQAQWTRFAGRNPSEHGPATNFNGHQTDLTHPVETVSWLDGTRILTRLGLSLPSEAQWEYGCRAGTSTPWWTGENREALRGKVNLADQAFVRAGGLKSIAEDWPDLDDGWGVHAPVGTFAPNAFGLHEVHGNVYEWCRDGYGGYDLPLRPGDGERLAPAATLHVTRGGSYLDTAASARSAFRAWCAPEFRSYSLGLRPARVITGN
jgi:serine/threonine protein kinase/formylglycine-generating enzyme required for sulfatase activity